MRDEGYGMPVIAPKVVGITQAVTRDRSCAMVTLEVDMADLEAVLANCDVTGVADLASYRNALDSAAAIVKIRAVEAQAQADADAANAPPPPTRSKSSTKGP